MTMPPEERSQLAFGLTLILVVFATTGWLTYRIGERNAGIAEEVAEFQRIARDEIEQRFRAEQRLAQRDRDEIRAEADEARHLANKALAAPKTLVVKPVIVVPTAVVQATPAPSAPPKVSPTPTRRPDSGKLRFFR